MKKALVLPMSKYIAVPVGQLAADALRGKFAARKHFSVLAASGILVRQRGRALWKGIHWGQRGQALLHCSLRKKYANLELNLDPAGRRLTDEGIAAFFALIRTYRCPAYVRSTCMAGRSGGYVCNLPIESVVEIALRIQEELIVWTEPDPARVAWAARQTARNT